MQRTDRRSQEKFELPYPNAVTYEFTKDNTIVITKPNDSQWHMRSHWHKRHLDVQSITCVHGELRVFWAPRGNLGGGHVGVPSGASITFDVGDRKSWDLIGAVSGSFTENDADGPYQIIIEANQALHRNICGAILDSEGLPRFRSTPLWFKALYKMSSVTARERLSKRVLQMQLIAIYYHFDCHLYYGNINLGLPWTMWPFGGAPKRAKKLTLASMSWISDPIMFGTYWASRICLG